MQFDATNGDTFTLTILGYEFPETLYKLYDSNWLVVQVEVRASGRSWSARAPCLLTYEVEHVADWLEQAARGSIENPVWGFLEPCLELEIRERALHRYDLRINFDLELHPDWKAERGWQPNEMWVEFLVDSAKLTAAAQALRNQLLHYPQRAER